MLALTIDPHCTLCVRSQAQFPRGRILERGDLRTLSSHWIVAPKARACQSFWNRPVKSDQDAQMIEIRTLLEKVTHRILVFVCVVCFVVHEQTHTVMKCLYLLCIVTKHQPTIFHSSELRMLSTDWCWQVWFALMHPTQAFKGTMKPCVFSPSGTLPTSRYKSDFDVCVLRIWRQQAVQDPPCCANKLSPPIWDVASLVMAWHKSGTFWPTSWHVKREWIQLGDHCFVCWLQYGICMSAFWTVSCQRQTAKHWVNVSLPRIVCATQRSLRRHITGMWESFQINFTMQKLLRIARQLFNSTSMQAEIIEISDRCWTLTIGNFCTG